MKKFEKVDNYLVITDTETGITELERPTYTVMYQDDSQGVIMLKDIFHQTTLGGKSNGFKFSEIVDTDGNPFASYDELISFLRRSTGGSFSSGGGNGSGVTLDELFTVDRDVNGNIIQTNSIYDLGVPPKTLKVGEAVSISDLGQSPSYSTKYDGKNYIMMGYEFGDSGTSLPIVKVSEGPTDFNLQPIDNVTETFNTPVVFDIISQQDVIGLQYTLKILADTDIKLQVIRPASLGGEDTIIVDEIFNQEDLSLDGTTFILAPEVDFEVGVQYSLVFTAESGNIQIKGGSFSTRNTYGVGLAANVSNFIPYIRREKGYEYVKKKIAFEEEDDLIKSETPPTDTSKLWFNTLDKIVYFYQGSDWLSEQLFSTVFNDQGTTPNNTFFRVGNTVCNDLGVGYNLPFDIKVDKLSFSRAPNTSQPGNFWVYSNENTGTNNAAIEGIFSVGGSPRGFISPNSGINLSAGKYVSIRWNGNQTNNNIATLHYRKKYS